jgi:hypothetical protein
MNEISEHTTAGHVCKHSHNKRKILTFILRALSGPAARKQKAATAYSFHVHKSNTCLLKF